MTPEEKLMAIRDAFEKSFVHLANATYNFHCEGSLISNKREWTKEWMDWIVKLIENDQETIENESTQYLTYDEVLEVARKKEYGIQFTIFSNALQYIRGFHDGQWWLKNKNNENSKNNESSKNV